MSMNEYREGQRKAILIIKNFLKLRALKGYPEGAGSFYESCGKTSIREDFGIQSVVGILNEVVTKGMYHIVFDEQGNMGINFYWD